MENKSHPRPAPEEAENVKTIPEEPKKVEYTALSRMAGKALTRKPGKALSRPIPGQSEPKGEEKAEETKPKPEPAPKPKTKKKTPSGAENIDGKPAVL